MSNKKFHLNSFGLFKDKEKGITRLDLYLCRTSRVLPLEYEAIKFGVEKIIAESKRSLQSHDFGNYHLHDRDFGSPNWYQDQALTQRNKGFGRQVSATEIDKLLRKEPFQQQNPHFDVMVVDKDLTTTFDDPENNFIFGYGPYPNNIISVCRFRRFISDESLRHKSLAVLAAHELGHNLGLVLRNFNIGTEGYKFGHCDGEKEPCLMEQVNVPGTRIIEEQASLIFDRENWLCPDCTDEVTDRKEKLQRQGIHW